MRIDRRGFTAGAGALGVASVAAPAPAAARRTRYLLGADVSWVPEDEAAGATYFENGVQRDPLAILKDAGFDALKLRTFVDPANGYAKGRGAAWCGTEATAAFSQRIRKAGFHLSTTLHYSDTWADPQKQAKPAAWAVLPFAKLVDAVHRYTADTWATLKAAGAAPDMAVLGNETTFGMLWPEGRVPLTIPTGNPVTDREHMQPVPGGGWDRFAALLKAAIAATRDTLPGAPIVLHNHLGRHWGIVRDWTDNLVSRGVRFDALGFSCYQQQAEGDWARTFTEFTRRYPDIGFLALEYSSRKRYLNDLVHAQPNGWGSFIWEPIRHQEAIFTQAGRNAGGGPKSNLLSGGLNAAEAPGGTPVPAEPFHADPGGRFDADPAFLTLYRRMATDYRTRRL